MLHRIESADTGSHLARAPDRRQNQVMMDWLRPDDLANGLLAEAIAMSVEIFVIVRVIDWRRQRDEHRRMTRFRSRARKHLRRSLAVLEVSLKELREALDQLSREVTRGNSECEPIPFPAASSTATKTVLLRFDRLGRDFALFMQHLDEPSHAIFEATLNQLEWMLNIWFAQRLSDPAFQALWSDLERERQLSYLSQLEELRRGVAQTAMIASGIDAKLNYAESQDGGDAALLEMASQLANGTHVYSNARNWINLDPNPTAPIEAQGAST